MNRMTLGAVVFAALGSGCFSSTTMGLARTLNRGAVQGWVAAEGAVIASSAAPVGYPMVEGGVRVGVHDRVELGARLGLSGIGVEGKVGLLRSDTMDRGVNLSLNPMASFTGLVGAGAGFGQVGLQLPVLLGIDFSGHELVLGGRLSDHLFFGFAGSQGAAAHIFSAGASVGLALKLGSVRLLPEVSMLMPFAATDSSFTTSGVGVGGAIVHIGIGFLFGTANAYERVELPPAPVQSAPLPPPPPMPAPGTPPSDLSAPPPPPPSL